MILYLFFAFIFVGIESFCQESAIYVDVRDKRTYKITTIGNQIWMTENLNFAAKSESWCYAKKKENCDKYGRLYSWNSAMQACLKGWHLPSEKEWAELEKFLGIDKSEIKNRSWRGSNQGDRLKKEGDTKFDAVLCGYRYSNGKFMDVEKSTGFWTATPENDEEAYRRFINLENKNIDRDFENMNIGYSVRCIRDNK